MEQQLLELENDMTNYNKVKNLVVAQMIKEGYMSDEEGGEFAERCQVMIYKGTWFSRWFDKNMKDSKKEGWYLKIIEMHDKQTSIDDIIRRTANER
jgi:hypothetical protein